MTKRERIKKLKRQCEELKAEVLELEKKRLHMFTLSFEDIGLTRDFVEHDIYEPAEHHGRYNRIAPVEGEAFIFEFQYTVRRRKL